MHKIQFLKFIALITCVLASANALAIDPPTPVQPTPSTESGSPEQRAQMMQKMHEQQVKMHEAQAKVTRERDAQRLKAETLK